MNDKAILTQLLALILMIFAYNPIMSQLKTLSAEEGASSLLILISNLTPYILMFIILGFLVAIALQVLRG